MGNSVSYRDIPRHRASRISQRQTASACGCARSTARDVPREADENGLSWEDVATGRIAPEDVDSSPYGMLFGLAVSIARERIGHGTFATTCDDEVPVLPNARPEAFDDGCLGTYREV